MSPTPEQRAHFEAERSRADSLADAVAELDSRAAALWASVDSVRVLYGLASEGERAQVRERLHEAADAARAAPGDLPDEFTHESA